MYFRNTLYIRISPESVSIRDANTGVEVSEIPELAIGQSTKGGIVLAAGANARKAAGPHVEVVNPFAHPRSLVSDFTVAERLLKILVKRSFPNAWWRPAPRIVVHPLGEPEGGFTQVECRAFHELGLGAGATEVLVWEGRELSDAELKATTRPSGGGRVLD